jgi:MerR family transcriptional regulator, light-induced transcriptional regulator
MYLFSIHQVEVFTDMKAHTLRIWEKRYNVLNPSRTKGQNRRYNLGEVELILNIRLLIRSGLKISRVVTLGTQVIREKVAALTNKEDLRQKAIDLLIVYKFSLDIHAFEDVIDQCFSRFGIDGTLKHVILPFLGKVNLLCYSGSGNEVHLAVTVIRKKIIYAIESSGAHKSLHKTALLFLPKGEHYDLILLYMSYLLKMSGLRIIYLGTNVPEENILAIIGQKKPDHLFTYLTPGSNFNMHVIACHLRVKTSQQKLHAITADTGTHHCRKNIHFTHITAFPELLNSLEG